MASNYWKVKKGLNFEPVASAVSAKGDVAYNSASDTLEYYTGTLRTVVNTNETQTLTNKTLSGNTAVTLISGSGTLTLNTTGTVTLPNATDTLVGKATTDTLTNKSISTGGTNTIGATTISGVTGTTNVVFSASPAFSGTVTGAALSFTGNGKFGDPTQTSRFNIGDSTFSNGALSTIATFEGGADGSLGSMRIQFKIFPSATAGSRYSSINAGDGSANRPLVLNDGGGFVGLGAASVPSRLLHVNLASGDTSSRFQSATTGSFIEFQDSGTTAGRQPLIGAISDNTVFYTSTGSYTEKMRLDATGRLAIGDVTTTPADVITASGTNSWFNVVGNASNAFPLNNIAVGNNANGAFWTSWKTRSTTGAATTTISAGDNLATFRAYGANGTNYQLGGIITITSDSAGTVSATSMPGKIILATTPNGSNTPSDRLTILASGRATFSSDVYCSGEIVMDTNNTRLSLYRSAGDNLIDWSSGQTLKLSTQTSATGAGRSTRMSIDLNGNIVLGAAGGALSTSATDGFPYIPTMAGTPTGNSTDFSGMLPMVYDTSANKLWINTTGTTWKSVTFA